MTSARQCEHRKAFGSCRHTQCPYPEQSDYQCVGVYAGYCEVGLECVPDCPWSFSKSRKKVVNALLGEFLREKEE
jgi:hypothetical protein